jgi:hypothetical protein
MSGNRNQTVGRVFRTVVGEDASDVRWSRLKLFGSWSVIWMQLQHVSGNLRLCLFKYPSQESYIVFPVVPTTSHLGKLRDLRRALAVLVFELIRLRAFKELSFFRDSPPQNKSNLYTDVILKFSRAVHQMRLCEVADVRWAAENWNLADWNEENGDGLAIRFDLPASNRQFREGTPTACEFPVIGVQNGGSVSLSPSLPQRPPSLYCPI